MIMMLLSRLLLQWSRQHSNIFLILCMISCVVLIQQHCSNYVIVSGFSTTQSKSKSYEIFQKSTSLLDPTTGKPSGSLFEPQAKNKCLVVVLPQLGEFDSFEYCDFLVAAQPALEKNNIDLKVIGIASVEAANEFCQFTGLSSQCLRIDPNAIIHKELELYEGPKFEIPSSVSDGVIKFFLRQLPGGIPTDETQLRPVATAWLNYNAMCAGIGAPGTLQEILRGYFGDTTAPERFRENDLVSVGNGFITIGPGVGPTKLGPLKYTQWFADERGYQRPIELATVRLKHLVEVLTNWNIYVGNNVLNIPQRGGTYLFDINGKELYSYKSRGVLTYSATMSRPLTFLEPYIGKDMARNPLGLKDNNGISQDKQRGRGILKPLGKGMGLLQLLFKLETKLQALVWGGEESDLTLATKEIENTIKKHPIVVYTYGLSPFSSETLALLKEQNMTSMTHVEELGLEWFLLDKEQSVKRAALLNMTGQSSLPHIFINGKHIGGLFTGSTVKGGLAGLKESGQLQQMIKESSSS